MKKFTYPHWLRYSTMLLASIPLILIPLTVCSTPNPSNTQQNAIIEKIQTLQKSNAQWIEINVKTQRIIAWKGKELIYAVVVSTGKRATPTPTGIFAIQLKYRYARMKGSDYDVPDVPYTMYYDGPYAIHGAYWHKRFGTPVSHGCTNIAVNHARWLFQWAAIGTPVIVHK